jgi:aryl-alcohol dehydrogenase-like predicted oxidoreductase
MSQREVGRTPGGSRRHLRSSPRAPRPPSLTLQPPREVDLRGQLLRDDPVALAWLLQRAPNVLPIPGTSSLEHLRENLKAAALKLPATAIDKLNAIKHSP